MHLTNKKILLLVSGSIAAYKVNGLVRYFIKNDAEVQVVMSKDAEALVSRQTLSVLSKKPVYVDFFSEKGMWNNHVELALWADLMIVAPCTANTLARMVHGISDHLLIAVYLSAQCPVFIAPAMDVDMYRHPSTQENLSLAKRYGHHVIEATCGELASGLYGQGRMAEPETIIQHIEGYLEATHRPQTHAGKTVLITAGPTYEAIDAVRFIGNYASGKMGFALAEEAAHRGANVILIAGPNVQQTTHPHIDLHRVTSTKEMNACVFSFYDKVHIAIASAAVSDYTPKHFSDKKIKKKEDTLLLEFVKTPDILEQMGHRKKQQFLVGFALEDDNEAMHARQKMAAKNLNMLVLNSLRDEGAGFGGDTNKVSIFTPQQVRPFALKSKRAVASDIWDAIEEEMRNQTPSNTSSHSSIP